MSCDIGRIQLCHVKYYKAKVNVKELVFQNSLLITAIILSTCDQQSTAVVNNELCNACRHVDGAAPVGSADVCAGKPEQQMCSRGGTGPQPTCMFSVDD